MTSTSKTFKNTETSKVLFFLSLAILTYWWIGRLIDVYRFAVVGAIFELLWLFMLVGLFVLPVLALILLVREKFNVRSLHLYTIIIAVATILILVITA